MGLESGRGIENTCPAQSDKSFQSRIFRSGHPRVRVRFRMPPPESLMSSGDSCVVKGGLSRIPGVFSSILPPSGTVALYLSTVWCMGGYLRKFVAVMFAIRRLQFQLYPNWGQLRLFGCPVFDVAPVRSGRRAVCQCGGLRQRPCNRIAGHL